MMRVKRAQKVCNGKGMYNVNGISEGSKQIGGMNRSDAIDVRHYAASDDDDDDEAVEIN